MNFLYMKCHIKNVRLSFFYFFIKIKLQKHYTMITNQNTKKNKTSKKMINSIDQNGKNLINQKILDTILDDNDVVFSELITQNFSEDANPNKIFSFPNYKFPKILRNNPTYASLCSFFSAKKCLNSLSLLLPSGFSSMEIKRLDDSQRSLLHFACFGGCIEIVRQLDQEKYDLNARDIDGLLPSHYAAMGGHIDIMKYLWSKGADVTGMSYLKISATPIQLACLYGNLDIVQFIYEVVLNADTMFNNNIFEREHFIKRSAQSEEVFIFKVQNPLHFACMGGHENIVSYLLSRPLFANYFINEQGTAFRTPLHYACESGSLNIVKIIMSNPEFRMDFSNKDSRSYIPLGCAAAGGHLDIVKYLIQAKGFDINQEATKTKRTALEEAVLNDHIEVVKFLVDNGACDKLNDQKRGLIFLDALGTTNMELVRYLDKILKVPFDEYYINERPTKKKKSKNLFEQISSVTFGDKYMQQACLFENIEMVEFLLQKGCSFDSVYIEKKNSRKRNLFIDFLVQKNFIFSNPKALSPLHEWGF